jgi:type I restriction enzyme M protein
MLANTNRNHSKRLVTQQSVNSTVKSICDIMRRSNCAGALQYVPELTWILFLRILDERETREAGTRLG